MAIYQHILLTLDLTETSETIIMHATKFADLARAKLSLIHVIEPTHFNPNAANLEVSCCDKAQKTMAILGKKMIIPKDDQRIKFGSVKIQVLRLANELGVDMIMVGNHAQSPSLGSIANAIVHGADCDVLVIRNH